MLRSEPVAPPEDAPRYVHACHHGEWHLNLRFSDGREGARIPYRCNSRHHEGPCRDTWRRRLYARLMAGRLGSAPLEHVSFGTFTLPASVHRMVRDGVANGGDKAELIRSQHKAIGSMLRRWTRAVNARAKRAGAEPMGYFWYREAHKSGVPHVHMLIVSEWVAGMLSRRDAELEGAELEAADAHLAPIELRELGCSIGWGDRMDLQLAKSREALSSYATKLVGEVSKGSQTPEHMPLKCRSHGSSRGFLGPRIVDESATGWVTDEHGRKLSKTQVPEVDGGWDESGLAPALLGQAERRSDFESVTGIPWRGSHVSVSGWSAERLAAEKASRLAAAAEPRAAGVWDAEDVTVPNQGTVEDGWRWAETFYVDAPKSRTYVLRRRPEQYSPPPPRGQQELWKRGRCSDETRAIEKAAEGGRETPKKGAGRSEQTSSRRGVVRPLSECFGEEDRVGRGGESGLATEHKAKTAVRTCGGGG